MTAKSTMLHVRVDDALKAQATETLSQFGLTISDAVRILLTRIAREGALPAGLTSDAAAHDAWFKAKVREALAETGPTTSQQQVMQDAQDLIDRKRRARALG
jgi:DNA-damage-inducible protein J